MCKKTKPTSWKENDGVQNTNVEDPQGIKIVCQRQVGPTEKLQDLCLES
jgi:hypothetical protein